MSDSLNVNISVQQPEICSYTDLNTGIVSQIPLYSWMSVRAAQPSFFQTLTVCDTLNMPESVELRTVDYCNPPLSSIVSPVPVITNSATATWNLLSFIMAELPKNTPRLGLWTIQAAFRGNIVDMPAIPFNSWELLFSFDPQINRYYQGDQYTFQPTMQVWTDDPQDGVELTVATKINTCGYNTATGLFDVRVQLHWRLDPPVPPLLSVDNLNIRISGLMEWNCETPPPPP